MLPKIFSLPLTIQLCHELKKNVPQKEKVGNLLKWGANPYAMVNPGESVFKAIVSRLPDMNTIDLWLKSSGDLSRKSWKLRPNPLEDIVNSVSQTVYFREQVVQRLLDAGFKPDFNTLEKVLNQGHVRPGDFHRLESLKERQEAYWKTQQEPSAFKLKP